MCGTSCIYRPTLYVLTPNAIETPPVTLAAALRRVGPGMVLAASIVGSGELIATTTLGAQVGFTALWIILVSCAIKPVVQLELGRYTMATGRTSLEGFDLVPGPRLGAGWVGWAWAITVLLTQLQIGAMYGGSAQILNLLLPAVSVNVWVGVLVTLTIALLLGGGYDRVERLAVFKVGLFTFLTVCAAGVLLLRPDSITLGNLTTGFSFQLPAAGIATAMAVFGITGVGATELVQYPYWCIEKGYARFVGPRDGSAAWLARAHGWLRVMRLDIVCSLVIYTMATVAFYLLGAGVLNRLGLVPADRDMIVVLSRLYTETLGGWALWVFYVGAIVTLYGTVFASVAGHSRLYADFARVAGAFSRDDGRRRLLWRNVLVVLLSVVPACLYWWFRAPVQMVVAGGIAQAMMLPIIGSATIFLGRRHMPAEIRPGLGVQLFLWIATLVMFSFAGYYVWTRLTG